MVSDTYTFTAANNASYQNGNILTAAPPNVIVEAGAVLGGASGSRALDLLGGGYNLTVHGSVNQGYQTNASIHFDSTGAASTVTISETGQIQDGDTGITAFNAMTLNNAGFVSGTFYGIFGEGDDAFDLTNTGTITAQYYGVVLTTSGQSVLNNSGTISGSSAYQANAGTGVDLITNAAAGVLNGHIYTGGGDDVMVNHGTMNSMIVDMGDGNDSFTSYGSTLDRASYDLGTGDDVLVTGESDDIARDDLGSDSYTLGGGDDSYWATYNGDESGTDVVRAGDNEAVDFGLSQYGDAYQAFGKSDVLINIGVRALGDLEGRVATGFDVGHDQLYGFEAVFTDGGNDTIVGNGKANYLDGGRGDDTLAGRGGDDYLHGHIGDDTLIGGKGADQLSGNVGNDTYVFEETGDSTLALAGRDTVLNFDDGADVMQFAFLGDDAGFVESDSGFSGNGDAEIRAVSHAEGWLIKVDADGNGSADSAVLVIDAGHLIAWDAGDFGLL